MLADTQFFGPSETWPRELANYPYIEFWRRIDAALEQRAVPGLGVAILDDEARRTLFSDSSLTENPCIRVTMEQRRLTMVRRASNGQMGTQRRAGQPGDIGAIETL